MAIPGYTKAPGKRPSSILSDGTSQCVIGNKCQVCAEDEVTVLACSCVTPLVVLQPQENLSARYRENSLAHAKVGASADDAWSK